MASFNDISGNLGYDIMSPMYQALGGKGDPFAMDLGEGNPWLLGASQAQKLGQFDPKFFDDYTFDWQQAGPGNSGKLTAFDKTGANRGTWGQYDTPFGETLTDALMIAGAAFGGLGLAGAGPFSSLQGMFGGGAGAGGLTGVDAAMLDMGAGATTVGSGGTAAGAGAGLGAAAARGAMAGLGGAGTAAVGSGIGSGLGLGLGGAAAGGALSGIGKTVGNTIGKTIGGGNSSGGIDIGNILSGLAQMYMGNRQQESVMDLYKSLDSMYAPGSAYEKAMRQELDRRDAAAGRRSQYGPREVELQAKLAQARSGNATTLAGLLDKSNAGLASQLQSGLYLGKESGLNSIIGDFVKGAGGKIVDEIKSSDWWNDLFGGD